MSSESKHTETEVKIWVADLAEIERRLKSAGAVLHAARVYERNVRYEDADDSLTPDDRVLRLRQDTRVRLTYKEPGLSGTAGVISRTELEITVDNFETADLLLQKLGYHPAWVYEKYRTTYQLGDCEVVLDELPFGNFIEVEGEPAAIEQTLAAIGLAQAQRITASYSELFFLGKTMLGLDFRDLTFENFRGVRVPDEFFKE